MARLLSSCLSLAALALMVSTSLAQCQECGNGAVGANGVAGANGVVAANGRQGFGAASWNRPYTEDSSPDVFYNFYQPGNGGIPAAALPAPYPTPPLVGHQYTTYQPLMPNEWLYMHYRTYHQAYNNGHGLNRTTVLWHGTPVRTELKNIHKFFSIAR